MNYLEIKLTPDEERIFEFRMYQYNGIQIAINQFMATSSLTYNEEHYQRLTDTCIEKHRLLTEYILELLRSRDYADIPVQKLSYEYARGSLKVFLPQNPPQGRQLNRRQGQQPNQLSNQQRN